MLPGDSLLDFRLFSSIALPFCFDTGERWGMRDGVGAGKRGEGSDGIGLSGAAMALDVLGSVGQVPSRSQPHRDQLSIGKEDAVSPARRILICILVSHLTVHL